MPLEEQLRLNFPLVLYIFGMGGRYPKVEWELQSPIRLANLHKEFLKLVQAQANFTGNLLLCASATALLTATLK